MKYLKLFENIDIEWEEDIEEDEEKEFVYHHYYYELRQYPDRHDDAFFVIDPVEQEFEFGYGNNYHQNLELFIAFKKFLEKEYPKYKYDIVKITEEILK